jgi:hypothetical protein
VLILPKKQARIFQTTHAKRYGLAQMLEKAACGLENDAAPGRIDRPWRVASNI